MDTTALAVADLEVVVDESSRPLEERAADLRASSPAAYVVVARHVDDLERQGVTHEAALERALSAIGR